MQTITLAIVDDDPLFREGVGRILSDFPDIHVRACTGSVPEAVASLGGTELQVIVLSACHAAGINAALHKINTCRPDIRILLLSPSESPADISEAFRRGARGYLHKGARPDELVQAVRSVLHEENYLSPALGAKLLLQAVTARKTTECKQADLRAREAEILAMVRQGLSNKLIANQLGLSDKTVKHYMTLIFQKLGVRSRLEAAILPSSQPAGEPSPLPRALAAVVSQVVV
jgi:DNA-binding NarL/FixJ family response regulator